MFDLDWMALGDLMASRLSSNSSVVESSGHLDEYLSREDIELYRRLDLSETASTSGGGADGGSSSVYSSAAAAVLASAVAGGGGGGGGSSNTVITTTSMVFLPQTIVFCELRHEAFEDSVPTGPAESGLVSKWRPRDRVRMLIYVFNVVLF